jgi:hypothetical protein
LQGVCETFISDLDTFNKVVVHKVRDRIADAGFTEEKVYNDSLLRPYFTRVSGLLKGWESSIEKSQDVTHSIKEAVHKSAVVTV